MRCPYCVSEIADEALACPRCTRDLYLFKPLLEKIGQLEKTVAAHEAELATLKAAAPGVPAAVVAAVEATGAAPAAAAPAELTAAAEAVVAEAIATEEQAPAQTLLAGLAQVLVPVLVLLVLAHWLMLFIYDVKPLYLRFASILIPLPFGFFLAMQVRGRFWQAAAAGFGLAAVAVLAMLMVTASIDKVPVLPQDARDFRETLEYVASIGLAFMTGLLLGEYHARKKFAELKTNRVVLLLARAFVPNEEGKLGIEKAVKKLTKLQEAVMPAATGAASIYAGIKAYLGQLG